jgi:hypothetical protein
MILNRIIMVILMDCSIAVSQVASNSPSAVVPTNTLAIYLLTGERKPVLENIKLEPKPILTDGDFVSFNTNTQRFAIKAEAAKRLCHRLKWKAGFTEPRARGDGGLSYGFDWPDTPFVLRALYHLPFEIALFYD